MRSDVTLNDNLLIFYAVRECSGVRIVDSVISQSAMYFHKIVAPSLRIFLTIFSRNFSLAPVMHQPSTWSPVSADAISNRIGHFPLGTPEGVGREFFVDRQVGGRVHFQIPSPVNHSSRKLIARGAGDLRSARRRPVSKSRRLAHATAAALSPHL